MPAPLRAVLALLTAVLAVGGALVLRADSDGPVPGRPALAAAVALVALAAWPLVHRPRSVALLFGAVVAVQLGGHAVAQLATAGRLGHDGATALVCCPPVPAPAGAGPLDALTAQAGWLLLAVQLVAALLLALSLRGAQEAVLTLCRAVQRFCAPGLGRALRLLLAALQPVPAGRPAVPLPEAAPPRGRDLVGAVRRRGPPVQGLVPSVPSLRGACAR